MLIFPLQIERTDARGAAAGALRHARRCVREAEQGDRSGTVVRRVIDMILLEMLN